MHPSNSKYIELESIPLNELCKKEPGSIGLYVPHKDGGGKTAKSIASISSHAKSFAHKYGHRCVVQQVMLLERSLGIDVPAPLCMIKITITEHDQLTERGERYFKANGKNKKPGAA